jgi:tRNA dimethylallyltransferase
MSSTAASAGAELETVRVICGPTASGKTALAMRLAESFPVVVISADSRQIYRGFDIGTAKPTLDEQTRVPHACIDLAEPTERYSAALWAARAMHAIELARADQRIPLVVGGTGFYLRALFEPLFEDLPLDPERRAALETELAALSTEELRRWCDQLDPARAHLGRTQLLRSLETALLSGRRLSDLHRERPRAARFAARYLVADPGPVLSSRISERIDQMLAQGWIDEVRRLIEIVPDHAPAWNATGYLAVREQVEGTCSLAAARERVEIATRQYAKRQRTWFRHQLAGASVTRLDPLAPGAIDQASAWWSGETAA